MRRRTDNCCTLWAVLFSVTLFIYAIAAFNSGNLMRTNFPSDGNGKLCGVDYQNNHFVFFPNPEDTNNRVCVKSCPTSNTDKISCGGNCTGAAAYETTIADTRFGSYCFPTDQKLKEKIMTSSGLYRRQIFVDAY